MSFVKVFVDEAFEGVLPNQWEPKYTSLLDHGFVGLVDFMGDDSAIVNAARVSYGAGTKKTSSDEGLLRYLMRHQHNTPFEMVRFKFHVKAPIFVFRQWHRHRTASINEQSARYSEMTDEMYIPAFEDMAVQSTTNKQGRAEPLTEDAAAILQDIMKQCNNGSYDAYQVLLGKQEPEWVIHTDKKEIPPLARELARTVLPVSTYSQMYWTVDLRNLFHFIKLRSDSHAQKEIRVYSDAMLELIRPIVPVAVQAFLDYQMNAHTFSAMEMKTLKDLLQYAVFDPDKLKALGASDREAKDFITKLDLL